MNLSSFQVFLGQAWIILVGTDFCSQCRCLVELSNGARGDDCCDSRTDGLCQRNSNLGNSSEIPAYPDHQMMARSNGFEASDSVSDKSRKIPEPHNKVILHKNPELNNQPIELA